MGDAAAFQIGQRGCNSQGQNLAWLEGSTRIYMEIGSSQADIPENPLPLDRYLGIRESGVELHGQRYPDPAKASLFQRITP